jgi:hypothetical protein
MKATVRISALGLVLALAPAGAAQAACGIGTTIWQGRQGAVPWLAALTTDFWTFKGISTTFEIAGCTEKDNLLKRLTSAKVRHYAGNNFDRLAVDMARGEGEHLDAFAHLWQVDEEDRAEFTTLHDNVTVAEFLSELVRLMVEHETLSRYVQS